MVALHGERHHRLILLAGLVAHQCRVKMGRHKQDFMTRGQPSVDFEKDNFGAPDDREKRWGQD